MNKKYLELYTDYLIVSFGKTKATGLKFPVLLHRQIFTNKDDSTWILYLISNDLNLTTTKIETIYQKRWKVEECVILVSKNIER